MRTLLIRAQSALPAKLAELGGLPMINSWESFGFLLLALFVVLRRRRVESLIGMDENTHTSALESKKKTDEHHLKNIEVKELEIRRLNDQLMDKSREGYEQVVSERNDLRVRLNEEVHAHLATFRAKVEAEVKASELDRVRAERDDLSTLLKSALDTMEVSDGLEERSEEISNKMADAVREVSNPEIKIRRKPQPTRPGKRTDK